MINAGIRTRATLARVIAAGFADQARDAAALRQKIDGLSREVGRIDGQVKAGRVRQ